MTIQSARRLARFAGQHRAPGRPKVLRPDHPARDGDTLYPTTVVHPALAQHVLKRGHHQRKVGDRIVKGPWAGMRQVCLTLVERTTCPVTCALWDRCYGNQMHLAERILPGPALEARLAEELAELQDDHPGGYAVRLHILGDFYSMAYVHRWWEWLDRLPALHVWGYTAWPADTAMGKLLTVLGRRFPDRFRLRRSGGQGAWSARVAPVGYQPGRDEVICPAQTSKTLACATCGLCWSEAAAKKTIVFLEH